LHTETAALASISNRSKANLQGVFRQLHTWAWLDDVEYGRLLIVGLLILTLAAFAATGLALVLVLKSRKIADGKRRYHRIFGYLLWLPLLGWSASGFYHLLQSSLVEPVTGLRLGGAVADAGTLSTDFSWLQQLQGRALNSVSLIRGPDGEPLYRVGLAPDQESAPQNRNQRFDGRPQERSAVFASARSGRLLADFSDREQAQLLATRFAGVDASAIISMQLITQYGPDYDFRNKRLPVWRIDLDGVRNSMLFVDPVTGVLVDQARSIDRVERLSFSLLHKWNHLAPLIGRQARDLLIVATLLLLLGSASLGAIMLAKRRKPRRKASAAAGELPVSAQLKPQTR
jgi:hypothetical protein